MTSVEWLIDQLKDYDFLLSLHQFDINNAKEMHKQEMAQLPQQEISDEEIEKEIKSRYETPHYNSGFMDCAKWYREKLKQK